MDQKMVHFKGYSKNRVLDLGETDASVPWHRATSRRVTAHRILKIRAALPVLDSLRRAG